MKPENSKMHLCEAVDMVTDKSKEYISDEEAKKLKRLFAKHLKMYKEKGSTMSDSDWLDQLFKNELQDISEELEQDAAEIVNAINEFNNNLESVCEAARKGISKENWLVDKIQSTSVGMAINEYGQSLQLMDDFLYQKNMELVNALQRSADGHIKMSPNLDGNIAENMIAKTLEMSCFIQGKNVKVEVRDVFTKNSVDVRAVNLDNGKYQNYQLKFGKDAKATIDLIGRGNYNNQQIIVPSEQLDDVRAHFISKGSSKTITDHIEAWGAEGKKFTKKNMKELQLAAQEDTVMPSMDYSHYHTKDLAMSIGKNAGALALQAAAVTSGLNLASKIFKNENLDADKMVEMAIKSGADTSVKVVIAGTLQVAIRKGIINFIPKATPAGFIANLACIGVENVKIITTIATGELSMTKGLDQMGRVTTSMVGGLWGMAKGATIGAKLTIWVPVIGVSLAVITGFVGGMVGYFAGAKIGDMISDNGKIVANVAKSVAKAAVNGLKSTSRAKSKRVSLTSNVIAKFFI